MCFTGATTSNAVEQNSRKRNRQVLDDSVDTFVEKSPPKRQKKCPKILDGQYFEVRTRDEKTHKVSAVCKLCGTMQKGSLASTGNFLQHVKKHHSEKSDEIYQYITSTNEKGPSQKRTCPTIDHEKVISTM